MIHDPVTENEIRVVLADDYPLIRVGVRQALEDAPEGWDGQYSAICRVFYYTTGVWRKWF